MFKYLRLPGRTIAHRLASSMGFGLAPLTHKYTLGKIHQCKTRGMLLTPLEAMQLVHLVHATSELPGSIAELGVYRGASAKLILQTDVGRRRLYLFDTFTGLPEPNPRIDVVPKIGNFEKGLFACDVEDVKEYLYEYRDQIELVKGFFPESIVATGMQNVLKFSFVHLDADLYQSIFEGLRFFYARLVVGGIILVHDAVTCPGVRMALEDFKRLELYATVVELSGNQAMVVKISK